MASNLSINNPGAAAGHSKSPSQASHHSANSFSSSGGALGTPAVANGRRLSPIPSAGVAPANRPQDRAAVADADAPLDNDEKGVHDNEYHEADEVPQPAMTEAQLIEMQQECERFKEKFEKYVAFNPEREEKLEQSLNFYDMVFDIRSLRMFRSGWRFKGKITSLEDGKRKMLAVRDARCVSVYGKFKTGKTWLLRRLFKLWDNQPMGLDVSTVGISVVYPSARGALKQFCAVDVAGNDGAVEDSLADDQRATDIFIRDLAIEVSDIMLFVINKFDRETQTNLRRMHELLAARDKNNKNKNTLPIIIVHNYRAVKNSRDARTEIQNLERTYLYRGDDDGKNKSALKQDVIYDADDDSEPLDSNVPECWYMTDKTRHILLFNDDATSDDPKYTKAEPWGTAYNSRMLHGLRSYLRSVVHLGAAKDFFQLSLDFVNCQVPRYLQQYEDFVAKYIETPAANGQPGSLIMMPSSKVDPDAPSGSTPFPLKRLSFIEGGRVIYEHETILKGRVFYEEKTVKAGGDADGNEKFQYVIQVGAPGVTDVKDVKVALETNKLLRITVDFRRFNQSQGPINPQQLLIDETPSGVGIYELDLTRLHDMDSDYTVAAVTRNKLARSIKIIDGVIILRLPRNLSGVTY